MQNLIYLKFNKLGFENTITQCLFKSKLTNIKVLYTLVFISLRIYFTEREKFLEKNIALIVLEQC